MDMKIHPKIKQYLLPVIFRYSYNNWKKHCAVCSEFAYWADANKINIETIIPEHIEKRIREWQSEGVNAWEINNRIWILRNFFSRYKPGFNLIKGKHFLGHEIGYLTKEEINELESVVDKYPFVCAAYYLIKNYYLSFSKILSLSPKNVDLTRGIFQIDNRVFRFTNKLYEAIKCLMALKKGQEETIFPSSNTMYNHIMRLSDDVGCYLSYYRFYQTYLSLNILLRNNSINMGKNMYARRYFIIGFQTGLRPSKIHRIMQSMSRRKNIGT